MHAEYEALNEEAIRTRLSSNDSVWAREIRVHDEIDSTNTHLMKRAATESIDGVVCLAETQAGGRGRRGRTWLTPKGKSLAMSLGIDFAIPVSDLSPLSLVVGVAVADAIQELGIDTLSLKWPNDVLLAGKKAGGILIELA